MMVFPRSLFAVFLIVAASGTAFAGPKAKAPRQKAASQEAASTSLACLPGELRSALADVERKFGPVTVLSTHRPGAVVAGTGRPSQHRDCRAVDFRPSRNRGAIIAFLRKDPRVQGLGIYRSGHIHMDAGPYRVTWNK
ncbi:D-Ala-D-Ala carboxypeptidase family metallohydrolase [Xanthobacter sp. KR7-225]|uniref:D-Ala-D-Ala carboxypeptidase family metallohydrolase n=1 Tax=Xanthobacter sp. KR7-225 TaxID=3156613 RepID=UPI0032B50E4F